MHVCAEELCRDKADAMASILIKSSFLTLDLIDTLDFVRYPVKIGNFPQQAFLFKQSASQCLPNHAPFFFKRASNHYPTNRRSASASSQRSGRSSLRVMATGKLQEVLPPALDSTSEPPAIFDGTTRLYISYICPYAQRTWIARNYKGLQDKVKLVPIDLQNRPAWYKERVYPGNKVPSLEHNNQVKGESLDLLKYIDSSFEGPSLLPDDPAKQKFAEELISYCDSFNTTLYKSFKADGVPEEVGAAFDRLESALSKFDDGPFFLGQFSTVDIAYAPFIERFQYSFLELKKYDITAGRPNLTKWIEELNKIDAYKQTIQDPEVLLDIFKRRFLSK